VLTVSVLTALALTPSIAEACSSPDPIAEHHQDPEEAALDSEAPGAVGGIEVFVYRGQAPQCCGGTCSSSSCDDDGAIILEVVAATDDRTGADEMGYRFDFQEGTLPDGFSLPDYDFRLDSGRVPLYWSDGEVDVQDAFDFTVTISAVDLAGNLGPPSEIHIADAGEPPESECDDPAGCAVVPEKTGFGLLGALMAFALVLLRPGVTRRS
jgi:hypothetical protein